MQATPTHYTDPVFDVNQKYTALDNFFLKMIRDERDLPFIYLSIRLTLTIIPFALAFYAVEFIADVPAWAWWTALLVYWVYLIGICLGPYTLMLHNTSHRKLFKAEYSFLNHYIPVWLGLFFGQSPETYFTHHIGMHHAENNMEDDLSSTMSYQRDNPLHFAHYYITFLFGGVLELFRYFLGKNRNDYAMRTARGELFIIALCIILSVFVSFQATVVVFLFPIVLIRFAMMAGNWGQHAFIDPADPANNYRNSVSCINAVYNQKCFNDGYHIGHHLRPHLHWTEMSVDFQKNIEKYAEEDAIVFHTIDNFMVWVLLMTKNYTKLAYYFVNVGNRFTNEADVILMMQSRLQPVAAEGMIALEKN
jgi:fatty acid desaturase